MNQYLLGFFCCVSTFMCGCAQQNLETQDNTIGATNWPHDSNHKVNQSEHYSHYGNPASYSEKGRLYYVQRSAQGYHETGVASWYGPDFHKHRTSSGEVYDMHAMTAAHKTLPLPSYVRVTNLENGKEIIVKVNDRGPFVDDRIIDLSYAAANSLDIVLEGTAPVQVEAVGSSPTAHYYLQLGAFHMEHRAKKLQRKIATAYRNIPVQINKRKHQYIVSLGPLSSHKESEHYQAKLRELGVKKTLSYLK